MLFRTLRAFQSLSIRWKLQIAFFTVTMITTVFNRWLASNELDKMIGIARSHDVDPAVIEELEASHSLFIFNSFWESGIEFIIQFIIIAFVANLFVAPIVALCKALAAVEQGDLTSEVRRTSHDEIGVLESSFNSMLASLNGIMREINESGRHMGQSAYQIVALSNEIAENGKKEEARSHQVTEATRELQSISNSVHELAEGAMAQARATADKAQEGMASVQSNLETMRTTRAEVSAVSEHVAELDDATQRIYGIVDSIATIAEQTNLLALNAAIEAARAGEQGRGFAVVADEVRSLAARTTTSSGEINDIIASLGEKMTRARNGVASVVDHVDAAQQKAEATNEVIRTMDEYVGQTADANTRISESSNDQVEQLNALQESLDQFFETLNQNSMKVENTANIGDTMFQLTERMNRMMEGFRFDNEAKPMPRAAEEKRAMPRTRNHLLLRVCQGDAAYEGISQDLSMSGIRLLLKEPLASRQPIQVKLYLPYEDVDSYSKQTPLVLDGEVMHEDLQDQQYGYGVRFINLGPKQRESLRYCFEFFNKAPEFDS